MAAALLPAYLIVGTDEYKRDKAIARMRARLGSDGMEAFNLDERDMSQDPQMDDVVASLNTFPIGTAFRLVILWNCDRLPKAVSDPLVGYLKDPAPTTVCLVVADSLSKGSALYKVVAALDAKAVVDCAPKKAREMPRYVMGMARDHGVDLSLDAAEELVARVGENTRTLDNELKRLASMVEGGAIARADVERIVVRTAEAKPWALLDAVCERDMARTLEQLELQPPGSEVRLWSLMVPRLRELIIAKALVARGEAGAIAQTLGLADWQVRRHRAWVRNYSMDELVQALCDAAEVEQALKGSRDSALAFRLWLCGIVER